MSTFAPYYQVNLAGKLSPLMGSDSICPIDGRYGAQRAACEAIAHAYNLRHVQPGIIAAELRRGSIRHNTPWGGIHPTSTAHTEAVRAAKAKGIVAW